MKHLFTLLFLLLIYLPALAQRDFRPGFVAVPSGDTLRGLINYRESRSQNERCFFKLTSSAATQEFTPETALGYGLFGERIYETISVKLDSVRSARRVFAQVLVRGKADLLATGLQFYARKGGELFALTTSWKDVYVGNRWYKAEDRDYERLLTTYLMADCPSIRLAGGEGVRYTATALMKLFEVYNRCSNLVVEIHENKPWTKWEWSVYGGAALNQLRLFSVSTGTSSLISGGLTPAFGLQVGVSSPRRSERISTHLGVLVSSTLYTGSIDIPRGSDVFRSDVFLRVQSWQVPLLVRYSIPKAKLTPFVQAGFALRRNVTRSAWYQAERISQSVVVTERGNLPRASSPGLSLLIGAGLHAHLTPRFYLTAEVRAEQGLGGALDQNGTFTGEKPLSGMSFLLGFGLW
jgi:hypothetical protein